VGMYETAARSDWIDPKLMVARTGPNHAKFASSVRFLSKEEMKQKNKEGLSYPLLFAHGLGEVDISAAERYNSQLSIAFAPSPTKAGPSSPHASHSSSSSSPLSVSVGQMREKAKEINRDVSVATLRGSSEAKAANAYAYHSDTLAPRAVVGASEDLPNFCRRTLISGTFSPIKYR